MRPLDKLRALSRREPPAEGVSSLNSFISSPPRSLLQEEPGGALTKETKERETDLTQSASGPYERNEFNERTPAEQRRKTQASIDLITELWPGATINERASLASAGAGVPRTWAEGFAALCAMPPPTGFMPERWRRVVDAAGLFLERWADVAVACGWSLCDAFGCHPDRPGVRTDAMGVVLLLNRCRIVAVDEAGADLMTDTGARQRFRRRPLPPGTICIWELGR